MQDEGSDVDVKINNDKLNDSARSVLGLYEIRSTDPANASCRMQIHDERYFNAMLSIPVPSCINALANRRPTLSMAGNGLAEVGVFVLQGESRSTLCGLHDLE